MWDPQNVTWLAFDEKKLILSGTVPKDAPDKIHVAFTALDEIKETTSRTQMSIDVTRGGGDGNGREILPTDTVQKSGNKIKLAVGVVFGVAAAVVRGILKPIATHLMTIYSSDSPGMLPCHLSPMLCSTRTRRRRVRY